MELTGTLMLRVPQTMTEYVNHQKVNEFYDNKIDDLDKKNSTEANQNIYKEKKIDNLKGTKQNTIDQTKKSEDNHKVKIRVPRTVRGS